MTRAFILILSTLLISTNALAQWELDNAESTVNYVSIKKSAVGEVNGFGRLDGSIGNNGSMSVDIDLGSVETKIPVRDERMQTMLFDVAKYSKANISAALDVESLNDMKVGDTYMKPIGFNLTLHGMSKKLTADVRVVKLAENRILAVSETPVIVSAGDFNLSEGVEQLRQVAGLPSISTAVPVTFSLIFRQQ